MREIDDIIPKIREYSLTTEDLKTIADAIEAGCYALNLTQKTVCQDYIESIKVLSFLLGKYLSDNFRISGDDWRGENLEFPKLKEMIDQMDYSSIFAHKIWALGGNCMFQVISKSNYIEYIYGELIDVLNKVNSFLPTENEAPEEIQDRNEELNEISEEITQYVPSLPLIESEEFNTNLKHIENELKEAVSKMGKYGKGQEEIERWVSQFQETEERVFALKLLNNFRHYGDSEIINLYILTHNNLLRDFENPPNKNKIIFIPMGDAGSSGSGCMYQYRTYNNISENNITDCSRIGELESNKYETMIFFDDFIGTGDEATRFFGGIDFEGLKSKGISKFYLTVLVGFKAGIEKIEESFTDVTVIHAEKLDERDMCFSDSSMIFSEAERSRAKEIFKKYGEKLARDMPLGYNNFGALISFKHKCVNNTLPVIYSNACGWHPIFKKYPGR